jgi:hypothetical protein
MRERARGREIVGERSLKERQESKDGIKERVTRGTKKKDTFLALFH